MKKWKIILPVLIVCALGTVLYYCFMWSASPSEQAREDIPIVSQEGIRFGSPARKVDSAFGAPLETVKNVCDTADTLKTYRTVILGNSADVTCYFTVRNRLWDMDIRWELASAAEARALCQTVEDMITECYGRESGFWCEEAEEPNGDRSVTMGVEYGATGICFSIERTDATLSVSCLDQY